MSGYSLGYGKGEIEPRIAPLVDAVQRAGFITFSSCEGHEEIGDGRPSCFTSIAFYAHEDEAKLVHSFLLRYRERLVCSWCFQGGFVAHWETNEFVLGWTLENCGIMQPVEEGEFVRRTVQAAWTADIPTLIELFAEIADSRLPQGEAQTGGLFS